MPRTGTSSAPGLLPPPPNPAPARDGHQRRYRSPCPWPRSWKRSGRPLPARAPAPTPRPAARTRLPPPAQRHPDRRLAPSPARPLGPGRERAAPRPARPAPWRAASGLRRLSPPGHRCQPTLRRHRRRRADRPKESRRGGSRCGRNHRRANRPEESRHLIGRCGQGLQRTGGRRSCRPAEERRRPGLLAARRSQAPRTTTGPAAHPHRPSSAASAHLPGRSSFSDYIDNNSD